MKEKCIYQTCLITKRIKFHALFHNIVKYIIKISLINIHIILTGLHKILKASSNLIFQKIPPNNFLYETEITYTEIYHVSSFRTFIFPYVHRSITIFPKIISRFSSVTDFKPITRLNGQANEGRWIDSGNNGDDVNSSFWSRILAGFLFDASSCGRKLQTWPETRLTRQTA